MPVLCRSNHGKQFFDLLLQKHVRANLFVTLLVIYLAPHFARPLHLFCPFHNRKQCVSNFYWNLIGNFFDVLAAVYCLVVEILDPTGLTWFKFEHCSTPD